MCEIVIVTKSREAFSPLVKGLCAEKECTIHWSDSLQGAQAMASAAAPPDFMIVDEQVDGVPGMVIARHLVVANAMMNLVLVSSLSPEAFHEASEGLGIVAQLPPIPAAEEASKLLELIRSIKSLGG